MALSLKEIHTEWREKLLEKDLHQVIEILQEI